MLGAQLAQLEMAKRVAVADEDYDKAKEIKDEVDSLRGDIEQKVSTQPHIHSFSLFTSTATT